VAKKGNAKQFSQEDDDLLAELGVEVEAKSGSGKSAREERVIAGFEDIQRFVELHGNAPQHGEERDIFERIYAVRLDRLRTLEDCRTLIAPLDHQGLLSQAQSDAPNAILLNDDELLAALGAGAEEANITQLRHVRSQSEVRAAAEEIANRERCADFERFTPLFERAESELKSGVRETRRFGRDTSIEEGHFFILSGQMVYVAEVGEAFRAPNGEADARLRAIFSNGTESNLLRRSLQRALYKDESGRRLTDSNPGPLFSEIWEAGDVASGTIYVLRSLSEHPYVAKNRELIHKIGVTHGRIEDRISNAAAEPTFLLAGVEVIARYTLAGVNRMKLETLFHRIFAAARLDLSIEDGFGKSVQPQEWFLVPLHVIDEAVQRIRDGSIANVSYDRDTARLVG